ncbi:GNAT family N-acetyltransferase [Adhaeribacter aquaticus]|uniref:GNAT family N-acetyltransferase n=1 Tax=Adhaeribacter aquaticus TaxID=299567 RepID=UPI000410B227|nr:GNAT family N-acetyltransferase [Adhaeribacter aquaticus]
MVIKKITPEDTWPIRQKVMWPDKPISFVKLEEDKNGTHYGLYQDEVLTSVVSVFEVNGEIQFRKFATLQDKQKRGFGTLLLNHVLAEARSRKAKKVWCNARVHKKGYYEKFGLADTHQRFAKAGKEYTIMELILI